MTFMYRPGPAIRLTKNTTNYPEITDKSFIIPMDESFSISASQTLSQPVKELFQYIQEAVIGASGDLFGSTGSTFARAGLEIANLTGFQLGTKGYYAKAWAGASQPSTVSITAKFYRGMQGIWDSSVEAVGGARRVMALTLPYETAGGGVTLQSPVPSAITVFTTYATQVISDAIKSITTATGIGAQTATVATLSNPSSQANVGSSLNKSANSLKSSAISQFISTDTWELDFGYFDGRNIIPFLMLQRYIVESSTIKFGNQVEKNPDGWYYPTTAEVTLSMVSQDILTSANFSAAPQQSIYNQNNGGINK